MKQLFKVLFLVLIFSTPGLAKKVKIKFATVAPQGSTWVNIFKEFEKELKKKTSKRVKLKIYAGGIMGSESDVLKKIKVGQLHAGGFTGIGLGKLVPELRVLELPLLFKTYEEFDFVRDNMEDYFVKLFDKKGFVIMGWGEAGFTRAFSNIPINSRKDMEGVKMWMWEGDPLSKAIFESFGVVPVPLALGDVLMALQTKMVNAFPNSPYGAIALQWYSKVKYMNDLRVSNVIAANILQKKRFKKLKDEDRAIFKELVKKYSTKIIQATRKDNKKALKTMVSKGLTIIKTKPEAVKEFREKSELVHKQLTGNLFKEETLKKVKALIAQYRQKK